MPIKYTHQNFMGLFIHTVCFILTIIFKEEFLNVIGKIWRKNYSAWAEQLSTLLNSLFQLGFTFGLSSPLDAKKLCVCVCVYRQNCVCLGSNAELSIYPTHKPGQVGDSIPLVLRSFSQSTPCTLPKHWAWCEERWGCSRLKHRHTHGNKAQSVFFPVDLIQPCRDFRAEVHRRRFTTQKSIQVGCFTSEWRAAPLFSSQMWATVPYSGWLSTPCWVKSLFYSGLPSTGWWQSLNPFFWNPRLPKRWALIFTRWLHPPYKPDRQKPVPL